jgi:hypothetical protein
MSEPNVTIPFEVLIRSNMQLLTKLFKEGLTSPKSQLLLDGFSEYFKETLYNEFDEKAGKKVVESFVSALVECLSSKNYKNVELAASILREYIKHGEIPDTLISKLNDALTTNVPSSAKQAAFTLGCIGCSKPFQLELHEIGLIAIHDIDAGLCHNCSGGYNRTHNADAVIQVLVDNLNRPVSKDRARGVRWTCAIALGEIAYNNPDAIAKVFQPLRNTLKEEAARGAVIFALGCIGYTKPELIEDLIPKFRQVCDSGYNELSMVCRSALKKIGMQTNCLVSHLTEENFVSTVELFCERMSKYNVIMAGESVFAFGELAKKFPDKTICILKEKLETPHAGVLDQNLCAALGVVAQELPERRKEIVDILVANFKYRTTSFGVIENTSSVLAEIFSENSELIPPNLERVLQSYIKKFQKPNSRVQSVNHLLWVLMEKRKSKQVN